MIVLIVTVFSIDFYNNDDDFRVKENSKFEWQKKNLSIYHHDPTVNTTQ